MKCIVFFVCLCFAALGVRYVSQEQLIVSIIFGLMRLLLKFLLNVAATGQRAAAVDWLRWSLAGRELNFSPVGVVATAVPLRAVCHATVSCCAVLGLHLMLKQVLLLILGVEYIFIMINFHIFLWRTFLIIWSLTLQWRAKLRQLSWLLHLLRLRVDLSILIRKVFVY